MRPLNTKIGGDWPFKDCDLHRLWCNCSGHLPSSRERKIRQQNLSSSEMKAKKYTREGWGVGRGGTCFLHPRLLLPLPLPLRRDEHFPVLFSSCLPFPAHPISPPSSSHLLVSVCFFYHRHYHLLLLYLLFVLRFVSPFITLLSFFSHYSCKLGKTVYPFFTK